MATTKKVTTKKKAAAVRKPAAKVTKKAAAVLEVSEAVLPVEPVETAELEPIWQTAVRAAEDKKAIDIVVLDLREVTSFADYFVICSGSNSRQVQAIAEEIDVQLGKRGDKANNLEGYKNGEWVLADYGDMIVHVFSPTARAFYDLERLWRGAKTVAIPTA